MTATAAVIAFHPRQVAETAGAIYAAEGALALKPSHGGAPPRQRQPADVERSATIVARALLEVISGWRPPGQLARHTSCSLQQELERRAPRRPTGHRLKLLKVRLSHPADGVAEVCALAHDPNRGRVRVVALRMEDRCGEWVVTRLQTG